MGHHPCLTACLVTPRLIIRHGAQTDLRRFFLPFDHHLRRIIEAPNPACAPADGMRRNCWGLFAWCHRPIGSRVRC
jgi:hypothetical protein